MGCDSKERWFSNSESEPEFNATGLEHDRGDGCEFIDLCKAGMNQQGGPLQGALQGGYCTNQARIFAVNLIWKF